MSTKDKNPLFRSLRSVRLASTTGHIIFIEPGHPVALPPEVQEEAYKMGCVPVDASDEDNAPSIPQGEDREAAIIETINALILKGDETAFRKADGVPKVAAVEELFGYAVSGAEIELAFEKVKLIADTLSSDDNKAED